MTLSLQNATFDEHLSTLREVFHRLRNARLRLYKCKFCIDKLIYLGHIVNRERIPTDSKKVRDIAQWPEPIKQIQLTHYKIDTISQNRILISRFIKDFATIALIALTRKHARWTWGKDEAIAFESLKTTLTSAPVLACLDFAAICITNRREYILTSRY